MADCRLRMMQVVAAVFPSWQVTTLAACVAFQRFHAAQRIAAALCQAAAFEASPCNVFRKVFAWFCNVL